MKRIFLTISILALIMLSNSAFSQSNSYSTSGGEIIFSWAQLEYTPEFQSTFSEAKIVGEPVRFTAFFHIQQFWHLDLNNNLGFFTGIGLRNIGIISDENLPETYANPNGQYFSAKIIRRSYSLGLPLAIKVGSFKDHLHVYAGGEIEWTFHMKEKWWDSHSRSGTKTKTTSWWPNQITTFLPSAFVGLQFPGGINVRFKYYLENFLNHNYDTYSNATSPGHVVSDLTKYQTSNLFSVSLSFHFKTSKLIQQETKGAVASIHQ